MGTICLISVLIYLISFTGQPQPLDSGTFKKTNRDEGVVLEVNKNNIVIREIIIIAKTAFWFFMDSPCKYKKKVSDNPPHKKPVLDPHNHKKQ